MARTLSTQPLLTLTTDFGLTDSYVAQMKGVILSLCPAATLVDITHNIPKYNIYAAARILREAAGLYPDETVHLAVVDPGVGSERRRIIVRTEVPVAGEKSRHHYFVGPDNGLFSLVAPRLYRRGVWEIKNLEVLPTNLSTKTFEGRSIFAPVAALLLTSTGPQVFGESLEQAGAERSGIVELPEHELVMLPNGISGEVISFDSFGNAATNITRSAVGEENISVFFDGREVPLFEHFAQMPADTLCAIWNSQGELELACRERSAREDFRLRYMMRVEVFRR